MLLFIMYIIFLILICLTVAVVLEHLEYKRLMNQILGKVEESPLFTEERQYVINHRKLHPSAHMWSHTTYSSQ